MKNTFQIGRRDLLKGAVGAFLTLSATPFRPNANAQEVIKKTIPSSGELIPAMGMGTSRTFDVGSDKAALSQLAQVLQVFFDMGGSVIDSSPMYGSSEKVLGELLKTTKNKGNLFSATKVWTDGKQSGIKQMNESLNLWGLKSFDLMQIHNLRDWKVHLPTLRDWKEQGKIRYIGITTSHNQRHKELEHIMRTEELDFVQFSYSIGNRISEKTLLPLAADRGIATLINRPFERAELFSRVKGKPLPSWSSEFGCASWAQFFLKFVISNPSVTCTIPATAKVKHMEDNMAAGFGRLPDSETRKRMVQYFDSL